MLGGCKLSPCLCWRELTRRPQLANLLGGTVVLETIFAWPGIGRAIFEAIINQDFPLIQAGILVLGLIVVLINLSVDLLYRALNPRVDFS